MDERNTDSLMEKEKARILLLHLLGQLNTICEKAGIPYYASGGTCLGAVRHQGFIPWDDDIDVMMPRSYYKAFVEACERYLKAPVVIRTRENDPYFCCEYIKLCFQDDVYGYSDLSIDVFFLDETNPQRTFFRAWQHFLLRQLYCIKTYKVGRIGKGKSYHPHHFFRRMWLGFWSKLLSLKCIDKWNKAVMLAEKHEGAYWINWGSCYSYKKATYSKKALGTPRKLPFENTYVYVAEHTEEILVHLYGPNYMVPPPPEKRTDHGVREIHCSELERTGILSDNQTGTSL